jgi:hypothetical protein
MGLISVEEFVGDQERMAEALPGFGWGERFEEGLELGDFVGVWFAGVDAADQMVELFLLGSVGGLEALG